jgi:hypothetical protein
MRPADIVALMLTESVGTSANSECCLHSLPPLVVPAASPCVQMRLPALLVAHTFLFAFDIGLRHICGQRGWPVMAQALGLRACALAVGLGLDAARRMTFKKEVPTRGAGTPTQHS